MPHGNYKENNHNNHILITDYGQEKYDYDLITIIARVIFD